MQSSPEALPADTIEFASRMFDAARNGNQELLIAAIDAGLPVNMTNDSGNTLLMLSSYAGHDQLTQALLHRGASPNRLNDRNQSPLSGAIFKGHDNIVRMLCKAGADATIGHPTAIDTATMFGKSEQFADLFGPQPNGEMSA